MFKNLSSAFSFLKNIDKIKEGLSVTYVAIVKTLSTLEFIQSQVNDTKLGKTLEQYLPKTIEVLTKVKELFEKYGQYIGLDVSVVSQASLSENTLVKELDASAAELNEFLK